MNDTTARRRLCIALTVLVRVLTTAEIALGFVLIWMHGGDTKERWIDTLFFLAVLDLGAMFCAWRAWDEDDRD